MGMAMAGPMLSSAVPGASPPAPPAASWHIAENGQTLGPFGLEALAQAAAQGRFRLDTLVWTAGMASWTPAAQMPQLASLFQTPPPPPPPARDQG
jgi:hypothetical protein